MSYGMVLRNIGATKTTINKEKQSLADVFFQKLFGKRRASFGHYNFKNEVENVVLGSRSGPNVLRI